MAEKSVIPILNGSGQFQEIHYTNKTVNVAPGEKHNLDLSKINRAELSRIKNIFTEIVKEKASTKSATTDKAEPPANKPTPASAAPINEKEGK